MEQETTAVADQPTEAESVSAEQDGGGAPEGIGETDGVQPEGEARGNAEQESIGPDNLSPELEEQKKNLLKDYHAKTQALAGKERELSSRAEEGERVSKTFQKLLNQDWFKKAYADFKAGRQAQAFEVTDEQFQAAVQDKRAFQELLDKRVEAIIQAKYGERLAQYDQELGELRGNSEVKDLKDSYKDFGDYHADGSLKPYLNKGYDMKAAYALAKLDAGKTGGEQQVQKGVQERLQTMKKGAVATRGVAKVTGSPVLKVKKGEDPWSIFDKMFEASMKNPDVRLESE